MAYHNSNSQTSQWQVDSEGFPIGRVRKKAMTKVRPNRDGNGSNRGILIYHPETGKERWVNVSSMNEVCKMPNGTMITFHGKGARPSLTVNTSLYDQIDSSIRESRPENYQHEIDEHYVNQVSNVSKNIDEHLLEQISLVLSNGVNLAASLNPQLSEESLVKIAISASIQYFKLKEDSPF